MTVLSRDRVQVRFSPDGRWIVYQVNEPAVRKPEIFVKPVAFSGVAKQISVNGGHVPVWRRDGQEILYLNGSTIYSVRVRLGRNEIAASAPEPLFDVRVPVGLVGDSVPLAVTRDGSRILFAQSIEGADRSANYMMTAWHQ